MKTQLISAINNWRASDQSVSESILCDMEKYIK